MADAPSATTRDDDLARRLAALEAQLLATEQLRRKIRWVSLLGILLLLAILGVFIYRLYSHFDQTYYQRFSADPTGYVQDLSQKLEFQKFMESQMKATGEVLVAKGTDFGQRVYNEVLAATPQIEDRMEKLLTNLNQHARDRAEERLTAALVAGIERSDKDIRQMFPGLDDEAWQKNLEKATDDFNEKLADQLEERIAMVAACLVELKEAANRVGRSPTDLELTQENLPVIEERLLDTLLDLFIYELKPHLGELPAEPAPLKPPSALKKQPPAGKTPPAAKPPPAAEQPKEVRQ